MNVLFTYGLYRRTSTICVTASNYKIEDDLQNGDTIIRFQIPELKETFEVVLSTYTVFEVNDESIKTTARAMMMRALQRKSIFIEFYQNLMDKKFLDKDVKQVNQDGSVKYIIKPNRVLIITE